jgi:hypothetical protein
MLARVVSDTRAILDAVSDGRKFLAAKHPDAAKDFAELLRQMQATVVGLAEVTKIVRAYRFVPTGPAADFEPVRFNDYVLKESVKVVELQGQIRTLKADCEKVRVVRDALNARGQSNDWTSMFGLIGVASRDRANELAAALSNFYADDQRMIELIALMLALAQQAIAEIGDALGPPGTAYPENVAAAAAVLQMYAAAFEQSHRDLHELAESLRDTAAALAPI